MKKLFLITSLLVSITIMPACSGAVKEAAPGIEQTAKTEKTETQSQSKNAAVPVKKTKILVAYFSATGNTQAVAERIAQLTGADLYRIAAAEAYAKDPYDDTDRIKKEAYNNLRPKVSNLPDASTIAQYDTIFVGSPIWWHQPAMVVCTFLDAYDFKGKKIIPFFTYGAKSYLNESMQKIYKLTPKSTHIPASLPEDLDPDDITTPGRDDDDGIDMPGSARRTEAWLKRIGVISSAE